MDKYIKKIAIVHPEIGFAGTETILIWAIESLRQKYDVSVITCKKRDLDLINRFYGSSLSRKDFSFIEINMPSFIRNSSKARLLKVHLLIKYCKHIYNKFDLFISTYGEMDFGQRGIQYIHFPEINCEAKFVLNSRFSNNPFLKEPYQKLCRIISRYSVRQMRNNITLVNSRWTKKIVDNFYGISSIVVYPPVIDNFPKVRWEEKEKGFVFVGRISPDKRPLEVIQILKKVREKGFDVHIHILGNTGMDKSYVEKVKLEALNNPSWIFYEGRVSRERLRQVVSTHKYGINGKKFEHFGIAIAEMAKAGCIIFVNNDGGQVEIASNNEKLIYNSDDDAVDKIVRILKGALLQRDILKKLHEQTEEYSKENFIIRIREVVEKFFGGKL